MNHKILFLFFFILLSSTLVYSNSIKYEINTTYPNSLPYYIGTQVNDLKISFLDNAGKLINNDKLNLLEVKLGNKKFAFKKEKDNSYHLKNFIITEELIINNKFIVQINTLLDKAYLNTKQTYTIGDISDIIIINNNPENDYKKLTIGETFNLLIKFNDLKQQNISNLNCTLDKYNSKNKFNCSKINCEYILIAEDKDYDIYCTFEKAINTVKKTYPLYYKINPEISEGILLGNIKNPEKGTIKNPFELCFDLLYSSGNKVKDLEFFSFLVNNSKKDIYPRNDYFCYSKFLMPFTNLDENITITFLDSEYDFEIKQKMNSGIYWIIFFILLGLIIVINLVLVLKAVLYKDTPETLTEQREIYKTRLKNIKESYLQGDITKKEFDLKLNEYSIKISYLNEKLISEKRKNNDINQNIKILPKFMEDKMPKKANKDLLNIINNDNSNNDDDLVVIDAKDNGFTKFSDDIENNNLDHKEKKENKFITFFKNLFKRKPKEKKQKDYAIEGNITSDSEKEAYQGYNLQDEFDIKKWQK